MSNQELSRVELLMMAALDDELDDIQTAELFDALEADPELAREFASMQDIDVLLTETPLAPLPGDFADRTLAHLPNPKARRIFLTGFILALAIGVAIPLVGVILLSVRFADGSLSALFTESTVDLFNRLRAIGFASLSLFSVALREFPIIYAYILGLIGSIAVWFSLMRWFGNQVILVPAHVAQGVR